MIGNLLNEVNETKVIFERIEDSLKTISHDIVAGSFSVSPSNVSDPDHLAQLSEAISNKVLQNLYAGISSKMGLPQPFLDFVKGELFNL